MDPQNPAGMRIKITKNGPYLVSGAVPLCKEVIGTNEGGESVQWETGQTYPTQAQYALCRCGHSANKPFCDGTHVSIGFSDER